MPFFLTLIILKSTLLVRSLAKTITFNPKNKVFVIYIAFLSLNLDIFFFRSYNQAFKIYQN